MSFAITDLITIAVIVLSFWIGWSKGFVNVMLGPLSVAVALIGSYWAFQHYDNIYYSLAAGIIGPIILRAIIFIFQKLGGTAISVLNKTRCSAEKQYCKKIRQVPSLRIALFLIINLIGCPISFYFLFYNK